MEPPSETLINIQSKRPSMINFVLRYGSLVVELITDIHHENRPSNSDIACCGGSNPDQSQIITIPSFV